MENFFKILGFLVDNWGVIVTILGFIFTVFIGVKRRKALASWIRKQLNGDAIRHNTCILLGQGGTGKTTLISRVTNDAKAKPEVETNSFNLHEHRLSTHDYICRIVFADYRGQDLAVLSEGLSRMSLEDRQKVISLILMIDICDTIDALPRDREKPIDYRRLLSQTEQWCSQSIDAIVGIIGATQLRFALIFINKLDTLTRTEQEEHESEIKRLCIPLQDKLKKAIPGVSVEILLGSARGAESVDIRNKMARHAIMQE